MNKEKQIEEMAQFMAVISHLECGRKPCEECKWCGCERSEEADCTDYLIAEALYNAGYRKQSEGEWIKHCNTYECSVCKEELFIEYAEDYDAIEDWELNFCPFCGAKMKGGEE